jgi:hypothetical protein
MFALHPGTPDAPFYMAAAPDANRACHWKTPMTKAALRKRVTLAPLKNRRRRFYANVARSRWKRELKLILNFLHGGMHVENVARDNAIHGLCLDAGGGRSRLGADADAAPLPEFRRLVGDGVDCQGGRLFFG